MKRRYEIARADVKQNHLGLVVMAFEVGTAWSIEIKVPYTDLDHRALYEAAELEAERRWRWEQRQRERLDDSLF